MGVDGDPGHPEGVAEHHVRGLAADAGQLHQVVLVPGDLAAVPLAQRLGEADHVVGLGAVEAGGAQDALHLRAVGTGEVGGGGVAREQARRDRVHPLVRGLRGEHGGDQQLQGVLEVQLAVGVGVEADEFAVHPAGPADQGEARLPGGRRGPGGRRRPGLGGRGSITWHTQRVRTRAALRRGPGPTGPVRPRHGGADYVRNATGTAVSARSGRSRRLRSGRADVGCDGLVASPGRQAEITTWFHTRVRYTSHC